MTRRVFLSYSIAPSLAAQTRRTKKATEPKPAPIQGTPWPQWGGPGRDFLADSKGLAESWPATGPRQLWKRPLGEGYSCLLFQDNVIYTMYGRPGQEVVLAADASTGKTLWEYATAITFRSDAPDMGNGPHASGLVAGSRLFTVGVTGRLQCLDRMTGKVLWTQMLWSDHQGSRLVYGYASSPLPYRDLLVVPVGGDGRAMAAFRQADGSLAWIKNQAGNAYSSPVLINVDGLDQVVQLMQKSVFAVNPLNGDLQWHSSHEAGYGLNVATPVWTPGNLLFVSSAYGGGSRMLELRRDGNAVKVRELWHSPKLRIHHGNAVRLGEMLIFSNGDFGPAPLTGIDAKTGSIHWQDRQFPKSTLVAADGKILILDQDGNLALAKASLQGLQVVSKTSLLTNLSWTPPTLVGTTLFLRDRNTMMAVDLGA